MCRKSRRDVHEMMVQRWQVYLDSGVGWDVVDWRSSGIREEK